MLFFLTVGKNFFYINDAHMHMVTEQNYEQSSQFETIIKVK